MDNVYQPPQADIAYQTPADFIREQEHIKLLMIFHYIYAGFMILGTLAMFGYCMLFKAMINNPQFIQQMQRSSGPNSPAPPMQIFEMMIWFYYIAAFICFIAAVLNLLSAYWLQKRRNRMFSIVVGALNCLAIPFGTILGIFTIIVLVKENTKRIYAQSA